MVEEFEKNIRNSMIVKFTSDNAVEIVQEDFTGKSIKNLTFDEFAQCIIDAKENREEEKLGESVRTGLLPANSSVKTIEVIENKEAKKITYIVQKDIANISITYYDDKFKIKSLPTMLMAIRVTNGHFSEAKVCMVTDKRITYNTKLYRFPLANVFSDTRICWGRNRLSELDLNQYSDVSKIPGMFLTMPFNDHNYHGANTSKLEFRKLLEYLEKNNFDKKWLVPLGTTYDQWITKYVK